MNLRQIKILMTVAELGSINKASERLHVAQPALSRQIRLIEQELGIELFVRGARGMVPTPAGELIVSRAPHIVRQFDDLRSDVLSMAGEMTGHVVFGAPPAVADQLACEVIDQFTARFPKVTLRIVASFSGHVARWLRSAEVDLAVLYEVPEINTLNVQPLMDEHLYLVGNKDAGLSIDQPVRFKRLSGESLVLPGTQHGARRVVDDVAAKRKVEIDVPLEVDSVHILKHMVERGYGYTILPMASIHHELKAGALTAAPITHPTLACRLVLAASAERPPSVITTHFAEILRAEVDRMVRQGLWVGDLLTD